MTILIILLFLSVGFIALLGNLLDANHRFPGLAGKFFMMVILFLLTWGFAERGTSPLSVNTISLWLTIVLWGSILREIRTDKHLKVLFSITGLLWLAILVWQRINIDRPDYAIFLGLVNMGLVVAFAWTLLRPLKLPSYMGTVCIFLLAFMIVSWFADFLLLILPVGDWIYLPRVIQSVVLLISLVLWTIYQTKDRNFLDSLHFGLLASLAVSISLIF